MGKRLLKADKDAVTAAYPKRNHNYSRSRYRGRVSLPIQDGCVFVISDQHYRPGEADTLAQRAAVALAYELQPWAVISNGDAIDGASISRWPVGSFQEMTDQPTVFAELAEAGRNLKVYEDMDFVQFTVWALGNHDARFESKLAAKAPEYAGVYGFTLRDHFPGWLPAWAVWLGDEVVVKHRFKSGMHAGQNNALWSGRSMVTGHLHRLRAVALTDYNGMRWGIEAGTMAPVDAQSSLNYTEDNPVNWQQGFAILHFQDGRFIGPELVHCYPDGRVPFRGELLDV